MPGPGRAGRFDIADIVRAHRAELQAAHSLSRAQKRVLTDLGQCRTAILGGHLDQCRRCGYEHPSYNSCRNRHCPKCQALAQEKWIAAQRDRTLDVRYFHVVFTLPEQIRPLARFASRSVYDVLFHAASRTLLEFATRRLGATIGATLVLHTWTRDLRFHPHVHAVVTGGGLSRDGLRWRSTRGRYLFPVKALAKVARAKTLDGLRAAYNEGLFDGFRPFRDPDAFDRLARQLASLDWNVYAKATFTKAAHVIEYLGRYTHRVGISNSRLLSVSSRQITFRTKGTASATVPPVEFLRRFVDHVLPDGFHKIRHYGLNASAPKRERARALLGDSVSMLPPQTWQARLHAVTGRDVTRCPRCEHQLATLPIRARAPPHHGDEA